MGKNSHRCRREWWAKMLYTRQFAPADTNWSDLSRSVPDNPAWRRRWAVFGIVERPLALRLYVLGFGGGPRVQCFTGGGSARRRRRLPLATLVGGSCLRNVQPRLSYRYLLGRHHSRTEDRTMTRGCDRCFPPLGTSSFEVPVKLAVFFEDCKPENVIASTEAEAGRAVPCPENCSLGVPDTLDRRRLSG
jgi:hypothetical protein